MKILHLFTVSQIPHIKWIYLTSCSIMSFFLLKQWHLLLCPSQREGLELLSFQNKKPCLKLLQTCLWHFSCLSCAWDHTLTFQVTTSCLTWFLRIVSWTVMPWPSFITNTASPSWWQKVLQYINLEPHGGHLKACLRPTPVYLTHFRGYSGSVPSQVVPSPYKAKTMGENVLNC